MGMAVATVEVSVKALELTLNIAAKSWFLTGFWANPNWFRA
jgi:hypothetical protein